VPVPTATLFPHKIAADVVVWGVAPIIAYLFRFDGAIPAEALPGLAWYAGIGLILKGIAVVVFRLNIQSWKHASFRDTVAVGRAVAAVGVAEVAVGLAIHAVLPLPRSVLPLSILLGALLLFGVRALRRVVHAHSGRYGKGAPGDGSRRVVIVGAGEGGHLVVREMLRHPQAGLTPVAIVDDDPSKHGLHIDGVPVLGAIDRLPDVLRDHAGDEVVIAIASADGALIRRVRALSNEATASMPVRVIPGVYEVLAGDVTVSRLRDVQIEDLLRRPPVPVDVSAVREYVDGATVLVTGAGGSIGSEIVRQLARCAPERIVLVGRGENSIYELQRELERLGVRVPTSAVIADVRDAYSLRNVFERYRPRIVFHAAAHKHLPLMEANPEQAVFNNVGGTRNVLMQALEYGVERVVNISTDKAVRPSSMLGASKRIAELLVHGAAQRAGPDQAFVSVRFGNVLGSRGSVLPVFRDQIRRGGPLTVTDPLMTRYFMTIPEACQLVLQAGALARNGSTYLLDMGQPVRIVTLAEDMIRLSGLRPYEDIDIVFTGKRPGEKMHEELLIEAEDALPTSHPHVRVAASVDEPTCPERVHVLVDGLLDAAREGNASRVRAKLREAVPFAVAAD
jgi:FlaA1/EpsC-like NDP-sugar epimerase